MEEAVAKSDLIYVAIPVDATIPMMRRIMDLVNKKQIVADAGSTKYALCSALADHPMRGRFVATHPMWGTEYSGPESAVKESFSGRTCVICEKEKSEADALDKIEETYELGMSIVHMDAYNHDIHAAYVSHISHITSFALANTVGKRKGRGCDFRTGRGWIRKYSKAGQKQPGHVGSDFHAKPRKCAGCFK